MTDPVPEPRMMFRDPKTGDIFEHNSHYTMLYSWQYLGHVGSDYDPVAKKRKRTCLECLGKGWIRRLFFFKEPCEACEENGWYHEDYE